MFFRLRRGLESWINGVVRPYLDDRSERPGVQFAEADLLGIPFRFVVSERNLKEGKIEWKRRDTGESGALDPSEALETAQGWIA